MFSALFFFKRPTAQDLRKFRFVSTNKPTKYLIDLVTRYQNWKKTHKNASKNDSDSDSDKEELVEIHFSHFADLQFVRF